MLGAFDGKYKEAGESFEKAAGLMGSTTIAANNVAVCSMYIQDCAEQGDRFMNEFQKAEERLEGLLKGDCSRNISPPLLLNLKALYETFAADPNQKKEIMKVRQALISRSTWPRTAARRPSF